MKKRFIITLLVSMSVLSACGKKEEGISIQTSQIEETGSSYENETDSQLVELEQTDVEIELESDNHNENNVDSDLELQEEVKLQDFSDLFGEVEGCVVIYDAENKAYIVHNDPMVDVEVSPYSTFKIVATLMGIDNQVLRDENTTMHYNNTKYEVALWNKNLSLKEAFQTSCIWYFRQVIDQIGIEEVNNELNELQYGNCDISQWEGSGLNPEPELNGFWLASTLKISPMEQVQVMKQIFQLQSRYTEDEVKLLKNVMLYDEVNGYQVWGKTGTCLNKEGWYVGTAQKEGNDYYFAIYLDGRNCENDVSGKLAHELILKIFEQNM